MRYLLSALCLFFLVTVSFPPDSMAHSTKGRIKISLSKKLPTVDDFAYFMESYVHRQFYIGKFEKPDKRFYVKDFKRVEHKGNTATVHFITLDNKEKSSFDDKMTFQRRSDGVWFYTEPTGKEVTVYTYVMKWGYYYNKYIFPLSLFGLAAGIVALIFLFIRRRNTAVHQTAET